MPPHSRSPLRRALLGLCLIALTLARLSAAGSAAPAEAQTWREAESMAALVARLERWLDDETELPANPAAPKVRLVFSLSGEGLGAARHGDGSRTRGAYDPARDTVYLLRPWSSADAADVSVLLHELVHHRQAAAPPRGCAGALEPAAYELQRRWLAEQGAVIAVNWIAVVINARCTPRDKHPD